MSAQDGLPQPAFQPFQFRLRVYGALDTQVKRLNALGVPAAMLDIRGSRHRVTLSDNLTALPLRPLGRLHERQVEKRRARLTALLADACLAA
jgi:hypothetical protein